MQAPAALCVPTRPELRGGPGNLGPEVLGGALGCWAWKAASSSARDLCFLSTARRPLCWVVSAQGCPSHPATALGALRIRQLRHSLPSSAFLLQSRAGLPVGGHSASSPGLQRGAMASGPLGALGWDSGVRGCGVMRKGRCLAPPPVFAHPHLEWDLPDGRGLCSPWTPLVALTQRHAAHTGPSRGHTLSPEVLSFQPQAGVLSGAQG